jgi:uncharacterized protein YndB with AHSA1/START domain
VARAELSVVIERPVEDVFAVLTDPEKQPEWSSATHEARKTSPGPIGLGSRARFVAKFLGRRIENESEVTEFEPNRRFTAETKSGPFPFKIAMTFAPVDAGTRVDLTIEAEPGGFFRIAEPLFVSLGKRQFESDLATLKDLMEADAL